MKCSRCPAPAHFNFGGASVLCVNCTLAMLEGCKINSVASMDLAPRDVVPAASTAPSVPSGVAGDNSELMCVEPSSIRVLDAGRSGRTDCSLIDPIGRDPVDGAVKAWSPGLRAVTGDNSLSALAPEMAADDGHCPGITDPPVAVAVNNSNPVAKEPEANARSAVATSGRLAMGSSRRDVPRSASATSEVMDVTAGETAPNSFDPGPCGFDLTIPEYIRRDANNEAPFTLVRS